MWNTFMFAGSERLMPFVVQHKLQTEKNNVMDFIKHNTHESQLSASASHTVAFHDLNLIIAFLTSITLFVNITGNSSSRANRNWGLGWRRRKMAYFLRNTQRLHKLDAYCACHTSRLCADELEAIRWSLGAKFSKPDSPWWTTPVMNDGMWRNVTWIINTATSKQWVGIEKYSSWHLPIMSIAVNKW